MFSTSFSKQQRKNSLTAGCKCLNHRKKTDGQHKMKQLKTRSERCAGRETSKTKSHRHHCCYRSSKEMARFNNCCCSSYNCSSGDAPSPNVIAAAQEPSIITDSRLIGHHGLFNYEVKSIDIERLLSEQMKHKKSEKQVKEIKHAMSRLCSPPLNSSPFSSKDLLGADINDFLPSEKKSHPATNIHDDYWEKDKTVSQKSDVTPGQRPWQELDPSSGSRKSIFGVKHTETHSCNASVIKSKKTNSDMSEKCKELSPLVDKNNVKTLNKKSKTYPTSTLEHTPMSGRPPVQQTQTRDLSPSPLQLSSSPITEGFDRKQDPCCVSESVRAVAARLCDCLPFTCLTKRNLVTETREVLLKALQDSHGPQLQENLLKVQQHPNLSSDLIKAVHKKPVALDKDVLFFSDASAFQADTPIQVFFDTQRKSSVNMSRSGDFICSSLQPHQSMAKTTEWLVNPEDTSASFLDNIFRSSCSPPFCLDSELPRGSASQHWEDGFDRPTSKEPFIFESFRNSIMNHHGAVRQSCVPHYSGSNIQPFIPYPALLSDGLSTEPMRISQESDPFVFSAQVHHPNLSNHLQTFTQFGHPSICPPPRSHHTDMMDYPPSHMLELDAAPSFSSFPSPEHWSFPPMRLY